MKISFVFGALDMSEFDYKCDKTLHRQDNSPTRVLKTVHRQNWRGCFLASFYSGPFQKVKSVIYENFYLKF